MSTRVEEWLKSHTDITDHKEIIGYLLTENEMWEEGSHRFHSKSIEAERQVHEEAMASAKRIAELKAENERLKNKPPLRNGVSPELWCRAWDDNQILKAENGRLEKKNARLLTYINAPSGSTSYLMDKIRELEAESERLEKMVTILSSSIQGEHHIRTEVIRQTAKDIIQYITDQGTIDCHGKDTVYFVTDLDVEELRAKYLKEMTWAEDSQPADMTHAKNW